MATPIKFYLDEHIANAVAHGLRQRGIDVLTVDEAGLLGATDEEHLQRARTGVRVVVTQDADFLRIYAAGSEHAGLIVTRQETSIGSLIRFLVLVHGIYTAEEFVGRVEFL